MQDGNARELVIVGAGPAGMTAAVYAARKKLDSVVYASNVGGMAAWSAGIENYMGYHLISGTELMSKFEDQVREFGIPIENRIVEKIDKKEDLFEVIVSGDSVTKSRSVIIATGRVPKKLDVPGENKFIGRGISFCATCDAPLFAGKDVAVIGGGNAALSSAEQLTRIASKVYVITIGDWTGDQVLQNRVAESPLVEVYKDHIVVEVEGQQFVEKIRIKSRETGDELDLPVKGVFVEIGSEPASRIVENMAKLTKRGEIMVDCGNRTNVEGLFAAGDVTDAPYKQVIVAAGEGAKAALSAYEYVIRNKNKS
jgi:alkyl hydroperoxide reductase subunit F